MSAEREKVHFISGGTRCAAWHYGGTNGVCVIMAGGLAVTKEPATDMFARRFHAAGFSVLAFDYRGLGESAGEPRLVLPMRAQQADWEAAIAFAGRLPGIAPDRLALWGFSASAGHLLPVAARNPQLAAVIAQTPYVGGLSATRKAAAHQTTSAMLRLTGLGLLDRLGGVCGRRPILIPLARERGTVALLATPDSLVGDRALNPGNRHPDWQQKVAARTALAMVTFRPGRAAARVRSPLLVVTCDDDQSTPAADVRRATRHAPLVEYSRVPGGHYAPFLDAHEQAVDDQLAFLNHHATRKVTTR